MTGKPAGEKARWKILYDTMREVKPGKLIRHEELGQALGLDFLEPGDKQVILQAARKAVAELLKVDRLVYRLVRGHGYERAEAEAVLQVVRRHQARAETEVLTGATKVEAIDISKLDPTMQKVVQATYLGLSRQRQYMRAMDIRQTNLEDAMNAVRNTADSAYHTAESAAAVADHAAAIAEKAAQKADTQDALIAALEARLAALRNTEAKLDALRNTTTDSRAG